MLRDNAGRHGNGHARGGRERVSNAVDELDRISSVSQRQGRCDVIQSQSTPTQGGGPRFTGLSQPQSAKFLTWF